MKYLKYTAYIYLIAGIYFAIDAYVLFTRNDPGAWLSLIIAALAVFMFFFRTRFSKRFENRNSRSNTSDNINNKD